MYKQINAQAGNNIADPQPIKTYSKMFQSLKPLAKFDRRAHFLICVIGLVVLIISNGFPVDIVRNRQVWSCLKRSDLRSCCFHWEVYFVFLGMSNVFSKFCEAHTNYVILRMWTLSAFNYPSWQLDEQTWKVFQKRARLIICETNCFLWASLCILQSFID